MSDLVSWLLTRGQREAEYGQNSLGQLRGLYPDQTVSDQQILKGFEQSQQGMSPWFKLPREEINRASPFSTKAAPGESSPVSDAMVKKFQSREAPILPISPESTELWSFDDNGNLAPTGKRMPKDARVVDNPVFKASIENAKDIRNFNQQLQLKDIEHEYGMQRETLQERGRNARHTSKNEEYAPGLFRKKDSGEFRRFTNEELNSLGEGSKDWEHVGASKTTGDEFESLFGGMLNEDQSGTQAAAGTAKGTSSKGGISREQARERLRQMGYAVPEK